MMARHAAVGTKTQRDPPWVATLRSDTTSVAIPAGVTKPTYLGNITDPNFGTKIVRISDDPGNAIANVTGGHWGKVVRHQYSLNQAWNCDESVLYLETNRDPELVVADTATPTGRLFLNGQTYAPLSYSGNAAPGGGNSDWRWHPFDPTQMVWVGGSGTNQIGLWTPSTNGSSVLRTFTGYTNLLIGQYKGFLSADGNMIIIMGKNPSAQNCFFAYNMVTDTKYPDILATMAETQISRNGTMITATDSADNTTIYTLGGTVLQTWPGNAGAGEPSHFDITTDQAGDEVCVGTGKVTMSGRLIKRRMTDGTITALTVASPKNYIQHTSTRATRYPGWCFSSLAFNGASFPLYTEEIIAAKLDGTKVCRICHTHAANETLPDYYGSAQVSVSPSGTRVIFGTAWYDPNSNSRPVYCMVADLR